MANEVQRSSMLVLGIWVRHKATGRVGRIIRVIRSLSGQIRYYVEWVNEHGNMTLLPEPGLEIVNGPDDQRLLPPYNDYSSPLRGRAHL